MKPAARNTAIGLAVIAVAGACALPYQSSRTLDKRLADMASQTSPQSDVLLRNLQHNAGYLTSKGSVDIVLRDRCHADDEPADTTFHVEYEAHHIPTVTASNRFDWKLKPNAQAAPMFQKLFGSDTPLTGQGAISWSGQISSDMALPALAYASDGERVEADASKGRLSMGEKALQFDWTLDRAAFRGHGHALEVKQIGIHLDLTNRQRGIGQMGLNVGSLSTAEASAEGFALKSVTSERGDKIDSVFSQSLRHVQFADQELKDMVLEASLNGLHAPSVETLTKVMGSSCGMETLTREESKQVRQALQTLLASGWSGGITKLSGNGKQGAIEGKLTLALGAVGPGQAISFAKQLTSSGELTVSGDLLPPMPRQMALASGMVKELPEGLKTSFQFEKGLLKVNGRTFDGAGIQNMLAMLDQGVTALLSDESPTAFAMEDKHEVSEPADEAPVALAPAEPPVEAAPAEAPPVALSNRPDPAPVSAPAPVAAAASECGDPSACVRMSLQAAWRDDVEGMRQAAAYIDALPKPNLGNKVQARKLNNQALEALQKGDASTSVILLQAAIKENPRDVEIASNLGFALLKDQRAKEAVAVLTEALVLDPRRTSTWAPLGEALAQTGKPGEGAAALWTAWQWSGNRDRTLTAFLERAEKEAAQRPGLAEVYRASAGWVARGEHPNFKPVR